MAYNALSFVWNVNEEAKVSVGLGGVVVPGEGWRGPRVLISTVLNAQGGGGIHRHRRYRLRAEKLACSQPFPQKPCCFVKLIGPAEWE